ncbi:MAG: hypothetical protein DRN66_00540 [Candidatus Nanohalarchaeota archaeon]|nr:MAG: hypothetical protein DRN66_00540 [Candidatus Nanohaloarchaeota archaeon]
MNLTFKGMADQIADISNLKLGIYQSKARNIAEFGFYSALAYFTPIFFAHPQIFTGVLVNSMLVCSALYIKGWKKLIPLLVLPSAGILSKGFLFGSLTVYLFYMLPFIWIGNAIFVFSIKAVHLKHKKHFLSAVIYGSVFKSVFLFGCTFALYSLGVVPVMFLTAFGVMQFTTALSAGIIMWPVNELRLKFNKPTTTTVHGTF